MVVGNVWCSDHPMYRWKKLWMVFVVDVTMHCIALIIEKVIKWKAPEIPSPTEFAFLPSAGLRGSRWKTPQKPSYGKLQNSAFRPSRGTQIALYSPCHRWSVVFCHIFIINSTVIKLCWHSQYSAMQTINKKLNRLKTLGCWALLTSSMAS